VFELRSDEDDRWVVRELARGEHGGGSSAHLVSAGGETDDAWNTYFYGTAPPVVSRGVVDGYKPEGGQVADGAWVLVSVRRTWCLATWRGSSSTPWAK